MSKRRQANETVIKKEYAGFTGQRLKVRIVDEDIKGSRGPYYCVHDCGDSDCREWLELDVLDDSNRVIDTVYHVSECEMEDTPYRPTG